MITKLFFPRIKEKINLRKVESIKALNNICKKNRKTAEARHRKLKTY